MTMPNEFPRRSFLRSVCCGTLGFAGMLGSGLAVGAEQKKTALSPEQALARMKKGNADFLAGSMREQAGNHDRRLQIARGQHPFAVLVGCSDSRVPPELLFGATLGELFIVRNAGNTVDTVALGSIEYGVLVLGAPLVVVLGHERCGAVEAAVQVVKDDATFPGSIGQMIEPIIPAVLRARRSGDLEGEALLAAAVQANVRRTVERLRESEPSLIEPQRSGAIRIVGATYDLDSGSVDFLME
jgi:carbonic anhydrase